MRESVVNTSAMTQPTQMNHQGSLPVALLRITLGVIILVTWIGNFDDGLYSASGDGIEGLVNWLFEAEDGNGSSLTAYQSILDNTILRFSGTFAVLQGIGELAIALGLLFGVCTRAAALGAMIFFANLFLSYYGGNEWIWTYVLLFMSSLTVFLGFGGRALGLDNWLADRFGRSPAGLVW